MAKSHTLFHQLALLRKNTRQLKAELQKTRDSIPKDSHRWLVRDLHGQLNEAVKDLEKAIDYMTPMRSHSDRRLPAEVSNA
jgi:hypothetical protein